MKKKPTDKRKKENVKTDENRAKNNDSIRKPEEERSEYGILPQRDLKKNLGCG